MLVNPEGAMESNAGPSLRVLSRPSSLASASSAGAPQSSSTVSSIQLSSSSVPYTPPASSFHFPPPPGHTVPSYPPPVCAPPLPSHSLLSPASSRPVSSNNPIHSGGKITILTSSAQSIPTSVQGSSIQSNVQSEVQFPSGSSQAQPITELSTIETPINNGVVVVGVAGRSEADASQLLNRILDAQIFGSRGVQTFNTDKTKLDNEDLWSSPSQRASLGHNDVKDTKRQELSIKCLKRMEWMKKHLKYYHDEEKGIIYLQFAWGTLPTEMLNVNTNEECLSTLLEEREGDTLRGLLYMFSVCHVVLLLQEGARVDTHLLRTLRILQSAKHLLAPYVKSEILPGLHSAPVAAESTAAIRSSFRTSGQSPGRSNTSGRNTSTIGLMSGSAPSFFPGQCTPVLLFVFIEDLTDPVTSSVHDRSDSSVGQVVSASQFGGGLFTSRQTVQLKGSNPVVMLARSSSKTEGGLRKKLQSSLEAQIRYLVKKCKILAGSGDTLGGGGSGIGPRGPGSNMSSNSGPLGGSSLFVLDTMRVACLLDKGANLQGDALEAAMGVLNDMLKRKEGVVNSLSELGGNVSEDIQTIRDFIWKQAEILRGRGGVLANSTGGTMGVGMVAAAAAAAAASAAAGGSGAAFKPLGNPPELPTISNWLSACNVLVEALTVGEGYTMKEMKKIMSVRGSGGSRRGSSESLSSNVQGKDALGVTLGSLESGVELDMKFSSEWCKRMFPKALAAYTKSLPPCYPTTLHQSQLEKALHMFRTMVRGPAVSLFISKLKEECELIWKSGRQLCDAVSLTGKPCIHKVHEVLQGSSSTVTSLKLHVKDLKDISAEKFEHDKIDDNLPKPHSSGLVFLHACACGRSRRLRDDPFDCESANISFFQFPNCEDLLPSLQIPDCEENAPMGGATWSLVRLGGAKYYQQSMGLMQSGFVHNKKFLQPWILTYSIDAQQDTCQQDLSKANHMPTGTLSFLDVLEQGKIHANNVKKNNVLEKTILTDKKSPYVMAPTTGWDERRLFVDVAKNTSDGDAFPPLQQRQTFQRTMRQSWPAEKKEITDLSTQSESPQPFLTVENNFQSKQQNFEGKANNISFWPASRLPAFGSVNEITKGSVTAGLKNTMIFIGFEHECPHGHRFLLSQEQLEGYGSIGPHSETSQQEPKDRKVDAGTGKIINKNFQHAEADAVESDHPIAGAQETSFKPHADTVFCNMDLLESSHCKLLNEGSGEGYNLLNTNLPIYMNCPYCNKLSEKKKRNGPAFAGNISQLQRIFLVTPSLPLLIAACPTVQFDDDCLAHAKQHGVFTDKFSLGCSVVLPPESFVVLRLPFIYYLELDGGIKYPLKCKTNQSEKTAWLLKGSTFKIVSNSTSAANV